MNYLYGDSTPSELKSNFLEFLRDALDFCVFVLQADARIKQGRVQIRVLGEQADAESERLERFVASVSTAVHQGEKGSANSPTAACGARLASLIVETHKSSIDGIRFALAESIARIKEEETTDRAACVRALGTLLAPHDPPNGSKVMQVEVADAGRYSATLDAKAEPALEWTLGLAIPDGHVWSSPMRVERVIPHLEIRAPQLSGWLTKEVKAKPQKLERHLITLIVDNGDSASFKLRTEGNADIGFDFEVDSAAVSVKAKRIGPPDDGSVGPFELAVEDIPLIVDLAAKLRASLSGIERRPNVDATFAGTEFGALPTFVDFVERLVATMAPIVREISQRSLTPNELVLRKSLANDRREEIFVAKATLREKLAVLPPEAHALFAPLGLEVAEKTKPASATAPSEKPPIRSELPPSHASAAPPPVVPPPPPLPKNASGLLPRVRPPAAPLVGSVPGSASSVGPAPPPPVSSPKPRPAQAALVTPGAPSTRPGLSTPLPSLADDAPLSEGPLVEVGAEEELEFTAVSFAEAVPEAGQLIVKREPEAAPRNEALVAALKKILMLSKNGRAAEAYEEYSSLYSSEAFAGYRPEDQRQALKLMVLAKSHPDVASVASAHKAALPRLKALVEGTSEAADQELLGVAQLFLGDEKAAGLAFQSALDVERARNPQSELVATLMRRVSQL